MNCKDCCFPVQCSPSVSLFRRYSTRRKNRKIVLMLVGLDNAGKSSTAKILAGEPVNTVVPTVGFNSIKLKHKGYSVIIYDLGGSSQIRGIWHRYFVDVHGVIFVVDASDLSRIDESRKVLEELLVHEKLAGKPLLVLANKQDREGALDELDVVERLNVEVLVNQYRCPTLVEPCSATGAPRGRKPQLDPGIDNGYRWLLRRIISDYERLNTRVEQDMEEQRVVNEAARQEWLRRQDTDTQSAVDSLPSETDGNLDDPFKPIDMLVVHAKKQVEHNGNAKGLKEAQSNGHVVALGPVTPSASEAEDSPDGSSHTFEGAGDGVYIPLHSPPPTTPPTTPPSAVEPNILVISEPQPIDIVMAVKEQFEWKMNKQKRKKKKLLLLRSNRTAPASASSETLIQQKELPPLKATKSYPSDRPATSKSLPSKGWGLTMSLEEVAPPSPPSALSSATAPVAHVAPASDVLRLEFLTSPRQLISSDSDNDDVVVYSPSS